jgi:cell division protein FtsA
MVDRADMISLPSTAAQGERQISRDLLAHIIHQRTDEIFNLVLRDVESSGYLGKLSGGMVITGGAAALPGTAELAADVFGTGVRLGTPKENITGLNDAVEAPRYATAVGLVLYAAHRFALGDAKSGAKKSSAGTPGVDKLAQRVKTWLQDFF